MMSDMDMNYVDADYVLLCFSIEHRQSFTNIESKVLPLYAGVFNYVYMIVDNSMVNCE
jgi:hypothetical protein